MKKLMGLVVSLLLVLVLSAETASASEGRIEVSNSDISCEGVSIWRESSYRVIGRCQGLVYPYQATADHYALWARLENGNYLRIDDVDRGYFEGQVSSPFASVLVTAEGSSSPRRPSTTQIVSGNVTPFDFDTSTNTTVQPSPAASSAPAGMTVQNNTANNQSRVTVGTVVGRIMRALLIIVAVVIVVAVVASLVFRRRGSVSAQ